MEVLAFPIFSTVVRYTAEIGKFSKFADGGMGCVVRSRAVIGERVIIGQNTTIGRSLDPEDIPVIGNDVLYLSSVRIVGKIHIGNNVIIGANAVVNSDIPDDSVAVGFPARVVRRVDESIWALLKNNSF